ncbi:MAG: hypothetical protein ISR90_01675 [Candidatus Marinimicrobia bacterium]|nr:hypothetical protein [Candidatus Neomarinimicrobiota bacterium]MBL7022754.1 hypothetical protein [Candidatus Neomarinimicrobiota bacterium]MBL7109608.1 hypothetical protein [Candidatus Neomarinimicrobiota bacterium]
MSRSYTPGLKVLHKTLVQKTRLLPLKGKVQGTIGEQVSPDTIVASTNIPGNIKMLNIANTLNIEPDTIFDYMQVDIDEEIQKGQLIAESKGLFGFFKTQVFSPIDGTLGNVSDVTGQVILNEPPIPIEVDAYTSGKIIEVIPEEGVVVETEASLIQGILGVGGESRGLIKILVKSPDQEITEELLTEDCEDKIIVGGSYISHQVFEKAQKLNVSAIVVGGFHYKDINKILGYALGVAITGSENLKTSLILTEGFGKIAMAQRTFDLLKENEGEFVAVNGATQIRAGVIRPEVLVPKTSSDSITHSLDDEGQAISENSIVRVIRDPYFGLIGKVKSLPSKLIRVESETMVRVAEVEFEDGNVSVIPRANLEMILSD